jgi:hypothetical protein
MEVSGSVEVVTSNLFGVQLQSSRLALEFVSAWRTRHAYSEVTRELIPQGMALLPLPRLTTTKTAEIFTISRSLLPCLYRKLHSSWLEG